MLEYVQFTCLAEDSQRLFNERAAEGYRLHTCEPVLLPVDEEGDMGLFLVAAMERIKPGVESQAEEEAAPMRMVG